MSRFRAGGYGQGQVWVRRVEHGLLRFVSFLFSLASAQAIRWFFSPLDPIDHFRPAITWILAGGFGLLGYFVSRGLAHRMMNHERVWAYVPIVLIVEFVEIFCNLCEALSTLSRSTWITLFPAKGQAVLTVLSCVMWSSIPLVSLFLAVLDMDLEREKRGQTGAQPKAGYGVLGGSPAPQVSYGGLSPLAPLAPAPAQKGGGLFGRKAAPSPAMNGTGVGAPSPFVGP